MQTITGKFPSRGEADHAVSALREAGVASDTIEVKDAAGNEAGLVLVTANVDETYFDAAQSILSSGSTATPDVPADDHYESAPVSDAITSLYPGADISRSDREERVKHRAYQLWEEAGRPEGQQEDHWHRASTSIEAQDAEARNSNSVTPDTLGKRDVFGVSAKPERRTKKQK